MNKAPFLICLLSVSFLASNAYSRVGDKGNGYGIVNLGVGQATLSSDTVQTTTVSGAIETANVKKTKASPVFDLGVGYYLFDSFRTDLSIYYAAAKYKFTTVTTTANGVTTTETIPSGAFEIKNKTLGLLWGISYELFTTAKFSPYLTVGAGFLQDSVKSPFSIKNKKKSYVAYMYGGGISYNIDSGVDLLVGYKYLSNKGSDIKYSYDSFDDAKLPATVVTTVKRKPTQIGQVGLKLTF